MTLEGRATFDVRHDPDHPLVIEAGAYEIRDIGTRFDLSEDGDMVRVAVFEGRVSVRSPKVAAAIEVPAGQVFTTVAPEAAATLAPLRASPAGDAVPGRLVYDDVPLGLVAADISRTTGQLVQIDPIPARRRFSGVLATTNRGTMVSTLSELAGLRMRTENDAIRLSDRTGR
jgi:transmembrane sensor